MRYTQVANFERYQATVPAHLIPKWEELINVWDARKTKKGVVSPYREPIHSMWCCFISCTIVY
jgi:hypothetical protein